MALYDHDFVYGLKVGEKKKRFNLMNIFLTKSIVVIIWPGEHKLGIMVFCRLFNFI